METHKSKEIKRKKIAIPPAMTTRDIMKNTASVPMGQEAHEEKASL